jgi:hypothetical protein
VKPRERVPPVWSPVYPIRTWIVWCPGGGETLESGQEAPGALAGEVAAAEWYAAKLYRQMDEGIRFSSIQLKVRQKIIMDGEGQTTYSDEVTVIVAARLVPAFEGRVK